MWRSSTYQVTHQRAKHVLCRPSSLKKIKLFSLADDQQNLKKDCDKLAKFELSQEDFLKESALFEAESNYFSQLALGVFFTGLGTFVVGLGFIFLGFFVAAGFGFLGSFAVVLTSLGPKLYFL